MTQEEANLLRELVAAAAPRYTVQIVDKADAIITRATEPAFMGEAILKIRAVCDALHEEWATDRHNALARVRSGLLEEALHMLGFGIGD